MSLQALLLNYGITMNQLMQQAARKGWTRDLSERVRLETAERILAHESAGEDTVDEAVSRAAKRASDILLGHRQDVKRLRKLLDMAVPNLELLLDPDTDFETLDVEKIKRATMILGKGQGLLDAVNKVADITMKVIGIERQAYDLDNRGGTSLDNIQEQAEAARQELIRRGVFIGDTDRRIIEAAPVREAAGGH